MAPRTQRKRPDTDTHTGAHREREQTDAQVAEAARHARELNDRVLRSSKQAANATLDAYERALQTTTGFTEKLAAASHIEWISSAAQAQAGLTRDLGRAYVASARTLLK